MRFFEKYIGQKPVINELSMVCNAVAEGRHIPHQPFFLDGDAGLGKTFLSDLFASELGRASGGEVKTVEINSATSITDFCGKWIDHIEGRRAVIKIDEAHALSKKMKNFLKPILETNRSVKVIPYEDFRFTSNPYEHQWIAMSNEEPRDPALFGPTGRFRTLSLTWYSPADMKAMIKQKVERWQGKLKIDDAAIDYLITRCVPNARSISQLVEGDCLLIGGHIKLADAKELCVKNGYFPRGLRREDIQALQFIGRDDKGRQVNEVAACVGKSPQTASYHLQVLAGYGFVVTQSGKKFLTSQGKQYLTDIVEAQKKAKKRS